jgi:hypothetical protein
VLGAGTPNVTHNGFQVTDAARNLVDENGNQLDGAFLTNHAGFPGFGEINASETLAYMADMQESGVPVTVAYGYISDIHGNESIPGVTACACAPAALGSGSACYVAQAQYYNRAFETFFARLAADCITPAKTLFVFSTEEGEHEAGVNVGRAIQPTPPKLRRGDSDRPDRDTRPPRRARIQPSRGARSVTASLASASAPGPSSWLACCSFKHLTRQRCRATSVPTVMA